MTTHPYDPYAETLVPRAAVRFPLRVPQPDGFDPDRPDTWPSVAGRLEYADGALWYMPPCGDDQQETTADVVTELNLWRRSHPEYVVGTNEAGMKLGGAVRAADAAVWRKRPNTGGWRSVPPILAVEVAGADDDVDALRDKAQWYLAHGVSLVWILVPASKSGIVVTAAGETTLGVDQTMPEHPALPDLHPRVADLFRQLT